MKSPIFHLRSSRNGRPALGSHRAASAAHRVLEAHQRRRPLGRPLLGLRSAELLRRARRAAVVSRSTGTKPSRSRRATSCCCRRRRASRCRASSRSGPSTSTRKWQPRRRVKSATARAVGAPTCGCSAAGSSSIRRIRRCWCRCCRRWCTCAASSGSRSWCGSSARKQANGDQAATSCSRAWSRCC